MHQGLEDVPALLSGGGDDGTHSGEVVGTPLGAEATGDLLAQLGHSEVTFGLIVRKRRARVGEESQASLLVLAEAEREVMTDAAFLSSALAGPERRLRLVEGDGVVEDAGPGPRDPGHQGGGHVAAVLTGEAGSPVCALKEAVHALCPVFLLDVDQGLEFAQVMGVAGAVAHALEGEVGGVIVVDEDAFEVLFDIAASCADAQDGQEWGAQHVEPAGTGHGRLTGQAGLYVEASRARDRFVLVTDNRESLEEALEENDGARLTAREAVGETDLPARPPDAAIRMLRDMRDDWRALLARAEAENTELNRMKGYARLVTGVQALAAGLDLPPEMQAFVDEVRQRDARMVEGRRDELAFVQKAEAHCHRQPLLKWAAEERGVAVSELPEHAAWLAEGAALEETGRRMQETPGFVGRITAALGRITARGCFRAAWSNEARRERILDPPKEVQERTLTLRRERSHGGGIGM